MARCKYDRNTDLVGIIVQKAKTMKLECRTYKPGIFLTIETDRASYWLTFVRIENLLILDNLKFAVVQCYKTMVFNKFLNAYKITEDVGKKKVIIKFVHRRCDTGRWRWIFINATGFDIGYFHHWFTYRCTINPNTQNNK